MRTALLARRRALPASSLAEAAASVLAELTFLVRGHAPAVVAGYVPIGAEPGGPGLPDALAGALGPGGRLLLPVLLPDLDLDWADYAGHASLTPGTRGLREPSGRRHGVDAVASAGLVVVPAVAVDRRGVRLGRGGGSYDRALARATGLTVALLHDGELVDEVPAEAHDQRVRAVITPGDGLVMLAA
jgi:5-formyltetrahydrofolate cyclo-ligase